MLRISDQQLESLGALALARFIEAAMKHVIGLDTARFRGVAPAAVEQWVVSCLARREAVGLVDDGPAVLRWLEVSAIHGDDLAEERLVVHVLNDPSSLERWGPARAAIDAHVAGLEMPPTEPEIPSPAPSEEPK